jgi:two-component system response regulator
MTDTLPAVIEVFLVEDNDDDVFLIQKAIGQTAWPAELAVARHGAEFLDRIATRPGESSVLPTLVLLDINMPRLDGFEALRRLKSDPRTRHIPVLILTTSNRREDVHRAFALGASSFLTKPPEFEELVAMLDRVLTYWIETTRIPYAN